MHRPTDRIVHTRAFVTPVVEHWLEREIAQWVHPMKDRSDDPSHHERTLLPRGNIRRLTVVDSNSIVLAHCLCFQVGVSDVNLDSLPGIRCNDHPFAQQVAETQIKVILM